MIASNSIFKCRSDVSLPDNHVKGLGAVLACGYDEIFHGIYEIRIRTNLRIVLREKREKLGLVGNYFRLPVIHNAHYFTLHFFTGERSVFGF